MSAAGLLRKLGRPPTLEDLQALPDELKGEIIDGELYVQPRPRARHARVEAAIVGSTHVELDLAPWWVSGT